MSSRRSTVAALSIAALCLAPTGAGAATTEIGAVAEIDASALPDPITAGADLGTYTVQTGERSGTYAVPAGYGVITAWRHSTGTTPGDLTLKVYRPTAAPGQFLVVAADPRTAVAGTVHTFPERIPVRPGDRIGISTTTVEVAYLTSDPADLMSVFDLEAPDPPVGSTATVDGAPFVGYKVDVSARLETDADGDGFGDVTQDGCPTNAGTQGACPPAAAYYPPPRGAIVSFFADCPRSSANGVKGTSGDDVLTGTSRGDRIFALAGEDVVDARAGADCVDLGAGKDRAEGGPGADLVVGQGGADRIAGDEGRDRLDGGRDGDSLLGGAANDRLSGDGGNDRLDGGDGNDHLSGGRERDRLLGGAGADALTGGSGDDRLLGDAGDDRLAGGSGADRLTGGPGRDRLSGGSGNDRIVARDGRRDVISCGRGRDLVVAADRFDRIARDCEQRRVPRSGALRLAPRSP